VNDARDLLFELGTEELPPLNLRALSAALTDSVRQGLETAGIAHGRVRSFATPRRLAVLIDACAVQAPDREIERRGPPLSRSFDPGGAPTQAAVAFAKSCGVPVADLESVTTEKGAWLMYRGTERGQAASSLIPGIVELGVASLPIAKRMRWGAHAAEFVRPVHWVVLLFGDEVLACEVLGLTAGRVTFGHRFHAPRPIALPAAKSYPGALRRARVIADFEQRRASIRAGVAALATAENAGALIDAGLLDEVTALVEWPVPVAGRFDERFLALPREVVIATVEDHQRYFPVEASDGRLTNWFITVSNIDSKEPAKVREGNERVVKPRLSDAAFFWDQDRKTSLQQQAAKLAGVTFQTQLGSYADKTRRIKELVEWIGGRIGAGTLVGRAAEFAKADLMTEMVREFPELQGTMGRYYALAQGEPEELALALEEQYRPRFAGDSLPITKTGQALALADKIDTITGIFAIEQRPTGTKDPFGLRRAALGVLRILMEGGLDLDLVELLEVAAAAQPVHRAEAAAEAHDFITERLRGLLSERGPGVTAEMIDAVLALRPRSPLDAGARLDALREFLRLPDAAVLAAANKRIANLLNKAGLDAGVAVDAGKFTEPAERQLHGAVAAVGPAVSQAMAARRYADSLRSLATLRPQIDAFFESVLVMDEHIERRHNRLAILREVRSLFSGVADLSRLPG
jgi:glycyl-tRNA synthetase beta chain